MTATIYLDESGDLGFDLAKARTSRFFVVAALFCPDPKPVEKLIKKVFAGFTKTQIKARHGVFHTYREDRRTREKLLRLLEKTDVRVIVIRLDKNRVFTKMADEKHVLYNYVVNILLDRLINQRLAPLDEPVRLVASQRETSSFLNANFKSYIHEFAGRRPGVALDVVIAPTSAHKGLQVVDCVSYSFFAKYEHGDSSYADLIASRVVEETHVLG
jgi:hypothetical protein